eukprot:XP_001694025.1 predicted protein [Chlamydomonas reinhardtii]
MAELAAALHQEALNTHVDDLIREGDASGRPIDLFSNESDDGVPAVQLASRSRNATATGTPAQPALWGREALGGKAMAATAAKETRESKQKERGLRAAVTRWMRDADLSQMFHPLTVMDACLPILRPDTIGRRMWDLLVMGMVVWTAVTVPLSVSFGTPRTLIWDAADHIMTALFGVDLLVNFRTAFYNHQGELIRDSAAIAANYMKMWFWIDLSGTIPWDALITATGVFSGHQDNSTTLAALGFLKAPRMLRLGRLLRFLDGFKNAKIFRIVQLFMAMILISHWLACIWYMMYAFGGKNNAEEWAFMKATVPDGGSQGLAYYIMLFYSSFLLLVGDNINAYNNYERTFYCVVEVLGVFFYSAVVGQMATLVATLNVTINRHGQKSIMTQDALRYMGVQDKVKDNVQSFFDFLQERSHPGAEGMAFLRELPSSLLRELQMYLYFKSVEKVPLFASLERGFLRALALRVQLQSMQPAEPVFRVGDVGHCMYFIRKGCVAVTSAHHEMVALLKQGEVFGEVALLSTGKRTANCTALGFVDLAAVMADFPQSAALIRQRAEERLTELAPVEEDEEDDSPGSEQDLGKGARATGVWEKDEARAVEQQSARLQRLYTRGSSQKPSTGAGYTSMASSTRDGVSAVFPEPGPGDVALAGLAAPDIFSSSLYVPSVGAVPGAGRQGAGTGAGTGRVGPGPVAEAMLEAISPPIAPSPGGAAGAPNQHNPLSPGRGVTTGGIAPGRSTGGGVRGGVPTATANQRRSSALSSGAQDAAADDLVAAVLAAGGVPLDGPARGNGHPYGHPHPSVAGGGIVSPPPHGGGAAGAQHRRNSRRESMIRLDGGPSSVGGYSAAAKLPDGGYYVSEKQWDQIMAVLKSVQGLRNREPQGAHHFIVNCFYSGC